MGETGRGAGGSVEVQDAADGGDHAVGAGLREPLELLVVRHRHVGLDRKSTRLNSSHGYISYAVFCLKKKKHEYSIVPHYIHQPSSYQQLTGTPRPPQL